MRVKAVAGSLLVVAVIVVAPHVREAWHDKTPDATPPASLPRTASVELLPKSPDISSTDAVTASHTAPDNVAGMPLEPAAAEAELQRLWQHVTDRSAERDWANALRLAQTCLAIHRRHFSDRLGEVCQILETIASLQTRSRDFAAALETAREVVRLRTDGQGAEHWQTVDARLNAALVEHLAQLSREQWSQFERADRLSTQTSTQLRAGHFAQALTAAAEALPLYENLIGPDRAPTLSCLANVLTCELELGRYKDAHPHLMELLKRQPRVWSDMHPETLRVVQLTGRYNEGVGELANAEEALRYTVGLNSALFGPGHLNTLLAWSDVGRVCAARENWKDANEILEGVLRDQQQALGDEHPVTAQTMKVLGAAYVEQRRLREAEPLLHKSVDVLRTHAGERHTTTASALNARGRFYLATLQLTEAHADLTESRAICIEQLGENHPNHIKVLENLALLYESDRDLGRARELRHEALRIAEGAFGPMNLITADAQLALARSYVEMSDHGRAAPYLLPACETLRQRFGDEHPKTAAAVARLADVLFKAGDPKRAEPLLVAAVDVLERSAENKADAARARTRLALLCQSEGRFVEAEEHYRRALDTATAGNDQLCATDAKIGLAQTLVSRGRVHEASELIEGVVHIYEQALAPDDQRWVDVLGIAGAAALAVGDFRRAETHIVRGLSVAQACMQRTKAFESERQQLAKMAMIREILDLYLSLPVHETADDVYPHVLAWKGAIAARQWRDRRNSGPEVAAMTAELQQVTRQLASLTLCEPQSDRREAWMERIFETAMRKERLEEQRAMVLGAAAADEPLPSVAELQRVLPEDAVLIDFFVYSHTAGESHGSERQVTRQQRGAAFVVTSSGPVVRVELGEVWRIIDAVLKLQGTRGFRPKEGGQDWAVTVANLVLTPLRPYLAERRMLLISPDSALSRLPWNMLPGRAPGTFLLEDHTIAIVPVPQLLPEIVETAEAAAQPESLLLVGGVDFSASPTPSLDRSPAKQGGRWKPLPGTAEEVRHVCGRFQRSFPRAETALLEGAGATEAAFWREAPRHRWLHIATHGFFAPSHVTTAIATQNRMDAGATPDQGVNMFQAGYYNGIVLAGANTGGVDGSDDGVVTATELGTMDLRNVEVAVLSGCETGLGNEHGGEGSLGMQRALQIAGVGATVGSLWTVSDKKTNLLMQRFYENLWDRRMPRVEALREAQLWMLNGAGGEASSKPGVAPTRLSPHYWAAFNLSGDWR